VELAAQLDGEIINADSMQLYRGMDIGTAKLSLQEQCGVPHHLLDVLDISERASVASYQRQARSIIGDVLARGRTPILLGGSGLYIRAVVDRIEFPGTDPMIRAALEAELSVAGTAVLFARLALLDPAAALAIEPANGRRIVRALEVIELTRRPFTATMPVPGPPLFDGILICVDRETAALDERLELRVRQMVDRGFLDEVRGLERLGLRDSITASRALGYPQLLGVLDGLTDLNTAMAETVRVTKRFVRRQRSWFGRDQRMHRLDAGAPELLKLALELARSGAVVAGT